MKFDKGLLIEKIVDIIKAGSDCGVSELKFGELQINFYPPSTGSPRVTQDFIVSDQDEVIGPVVLTSEGAQKPQTDEEAERERDEYLRAQEILTDPQAHEDNMIELAARG